MSEFERIIIVEHILIPMIKTVTWIRSEDVSGELLRITV